MFFSYLTKNGAIAEDSYPYEDKDGQCRFDKQKVQVQVKGCTNIKASEDQLMEKLVQIGPLSIGNTIYKRIAKLIHR